MEKLGYNGLRTVEPVGRSGGLAIMWKNTCRVEVKQTNRRLIDTKVQWQDKTFYLTGIYGEPIKNRRNEV